MSHTTESWFVTGGGAFISIGTQNDPFIAELHGDDVVYAGAKARRIVACLNACQAWTTEQLEQWAIEGKDRMSDLNGVSWEARIKVLEAERNQQQFVHDLTIKELERVVGQRDALVTALEGARNLEPRLDEDVDESYCGGCSHYAIEDGVIPHDEDCWVLLADELLAKAQGVTA